MANASPDSLEWFEGLIEVDAALRENHGHVRRIKQMAYHSAGVYRHDDDLLGQVFWEKIQRMCDFVQVRLVAVNRELRQATEEGWMFERFTALVEDLARVVDAIEAQAADGPRPNLPGRDQGHMADMV